MLILVEKILGENQTINQIFQRNHERIKKDNNYTQDDIDSVIVLYGNVTVLKSP